MSSPDHERVKELFLAAADLPESEQSHFLDEHCGSNIDLRREIESLLGYDTGQTLLAPHSNLIPVTTRSEEKQTPSKLPRSTRRPNEKTFRASIVLIVGGFVVVLALWNYFHVRSSLQEVRAAELETILNADIAAIEQWLGMEERRANLLARDRDFPAAVRNALVPAADDDLESVGDRLMGVVYEHFAVDEIAGCAVFDLERAMLANPNPKKTRRINAPPLDVLSQLATGQHRIFGPTLEIPWDVPDHDFDELVLLFFIEFDVPPPDGPASNGIQSPRSSTEPRAGILIALKANPQFTKLLRTARLGRSGETYAVSPSGRMLSESRSVDEQKEDSKSAGTTVDTQVGLPVAPPDSPVGQFTDPVTQMIKLAQNTPAPSGIHSNLSAYLDYRGKSVIGVWQWLPDYGFAVISEIDEAEAYAPANSLLYSIGVLMVVLTAISGYAISTVFSLRELRHSLTDEVSLGPYMLEEQIGEGGFGVVYRARHELLKRPTAVKVLRSDLNDEESINRFHREFKLAANLEHPNTIRIFDYGVSETGVFYCAMELLEGFTLDDLYFDYAPIPDGRVIDIIRQVCISLNEAHSIGLVHRDIKPANIMLCEIGGDPDIVKVLDFGLAKPFHGNASTDITKKGVISGTPVYIAPERIMQVKQIDGRSDLFAVGIVIYNLLTGEQPFDSDNALDELFQVMNDAPKPIDEELSKSIAPELIDLSLKCMQSEPSDRPESAAKMIQQLDAMTPRSPWSGEDAQQWWARNGKES